MLVEFHLYLSAKIPVNQDLTFSWDFWEEVESLLEEDSPQRIQERALEGAHYAPLTDREGFRHLYRFLSGIRRSERVVRSAQIRKRESKKRAMYRQQLGDKLKTALK